jgi:uncharacterized coiled-coil DUF342 family protein
MTAALGAAEATGQEIAQGAFLNPEETRQCVCMEEQISGMRVELDGWKQSRDELAAEFARLDELVEQARDTIDVNDQAEVDSFRRMHNRREELRQQLNQAREPYNEVLWRFNRVAEVYNAQCANRKMFKVNVDAARADAQCEPVP